MVYVAGVVAGGGGLAFRRRIRRRAALARAVLRRAAHRPRRRAVGLRSRLTPVAVPNTSPLGAAPLVSLAARLPMARLRRTVAAVARARVAKAENKARATTFPACDSKWTSANGGEVWCPDGRSRPRKEVTFSAGKEKTRCACFPDDAFSDTRRLYPGCGNTATRCSTGK